MKGVNFMHEDIKSFKEKNDFLRDKFDEVNYQAFYRDVFPKGSFERKSDYTERKGNGIAISILKDSTLNHLITDDFSELKHLMARDFVITSPISYFGGKRTAKNSSLLFGLAFDIDGTDIKKLAVLVQQLTNGVNPKPTYIINSGHGVHLYYIFNEPIKLYNHIKEPLKELKFALTNRLWNVNTSTIKEKQYQGIFQGFRMVGSPTKFGKDYKLKAYRMGEKIDLEYLNSFVSEDKQITTLDYQSDFTLEQAKEKYPEWYEKVIVQGNTKKKAWNIKRDLYDWWHEKIKNEASFGHRYFCVMVLAIYAKKCNISKKELKEDAYNLIPLFNKINALDPFTEKDVKSALKSYDERYRTFPRADIEKITAIDIPKNKRNYRTQETHLKLARGNLAILYELGEVDVGRPKGSGTKEEELKQWQKINPKGSKTDCKNDTGMSYTTIRKYWKE